MAETSKVAYPTKINPMFAIPNGVTQLVYEDASASSLPSSTGSVGGPTTQDPETVVGYDSTANESIYVQEAQVFVGTPEIISLIQDLSHAPGAPTVVDVIVTVEDIAGVTDYEIRIAKV